MRLKNIILCLIFAAAISSCTIDDGDNPNRKTNPGYVAFDYTCQMIKDFDVLYLNIYHFNEYYSQTTTAGRDSIDRLYFYDTKITYDNETKTWILRSINNSLQYYEIEINTNDKYLTDDGSKWTVSYLYQYNNSRYTFEIGNKSSNEFYVTNYSYQNFSFDITNEWIIKTDDNGRDYTLSGSGTMLSLVSPKLKLEYTVINPIKHVLNDNYYLKMEHGYLEILATDMNINETKKVEAEIAPSDVIIEYKGYEDSWNYDMSVPLHPFYAD